MQRGVCWGACVIVVSASLLASTHARAFCGFYVSEGAESPKAPATSVVLMRDGTRTVLTMRNDYVGPPEAFAMVVPIPVPIDAANVHIVPTDVLDRVETLASPRLVEYWQDEPSCPDPSVLGYRAVSIRSGMATSMGVVVQAEFSTGEYDIVVLGAADSMGLDTWLRTHGYNIPAGAEPLLRPYVMAGDYFLVAKVDAARVELHDGRARLSPLRIHYDSPRFSLPVRLGLMNSTGRQDLIVHIIARSRYELANYPNVTMPTNLEVSEDVRGRFGELYEALFERVIARHPRAAVTEYAWAAASCDPCPGPTLDGRDVTLLGGDVIPSADIQLSAVPTLRIAATEPEQRGELAGTLARAASANLAQCAPLLRWYDPQPIELTLGRGGHVLGARSDGSPFGRCAARAIFAGVRRRVFGGLRHATRVELRIASVHEPLRYLRSASGLTLTRIHMRYSARELRDDLVFRVASAIEGGRGVPDRSGEMDTRVRPASANAFQTRFAILHRWEGPPLACRHPLLGAWGAPRSSRVMSAARSTRVTDAPFDLAALLRTPVPAIGIVPRRIRVASLATAAEPPSP